MSDLLGPPLPPANCGPRPQSLFLVENGVLPARAGPKSDRVNALAKAGVEVLAEAFSLRERGITADRLAAGVKSAPLDVVIDRMADGSKTIWH